MDTMAFQLTNNHVHLPVTIGGREFSFLVDTGSGISFVSMTTARSLGLPLGAPFEVRGAGEGSWSGAMLHTPVMVLPGGRSAFELAVPAALPLEALEPHEGCAIDGILGYDFLRRHVVVIDYRARRLGLHEPSAFHPPAAGVVVPMTLQNNHPHVQAAVELEAGAWVRGDFVVDIGSCLAVSLTRSFAQARQVTSRLSHTFTAQAGRGVGPAATITVGRARGLRIGDLDIRYPVVGVFGDNAGVMSTGAFFDGNIGGALLRDYRVSLDYSRRQLVLDRQPDDGATASTVS